MTQKVLLQLRVNSEYREVAAVPSKTLLEVLREDLNLKWENAVAAPSCWTAIPLSPACCFLSRFRDRKSKLWRVWHEKVSCTHCSRPSLN